MTTLTKEIVVNGNSYSAESAESSIRQIKSFTFIHSILAEHPANLVTKLEAKYQMRSQMPISLC